MNKTRTLLLMGALSAFLVLGCEREPSVEAGREDRPEAGQTMPGTGAQPGGAQDTTAGQEVRGVLQSVSASEGTIAVRAADGQQQTYRIGPQTTITGLDAAMSREGAAAAALAGKEGSQVTVRWTQEGADRMATAIEVMESDAEGAAQPATPGGNRTY